MAFVYDSAILYVNF